MKVKCSSLGRWVAVLTLLFHCALALPQSYPSKPIQLVVAFAPGGAGDIVARIVARKLGEGLGQAVVVDNRPIPVAAVSSVVRAKPDGYTLIMAGSGTALTTALFKQLPYDLMADLIHVSTLASFDLVLATGGQSEFHSVSDVLAYAKANPGKLNIGTVRVGSTQNMAAEMLKSMAGIDAVIVPYKASGEVVSALRSKDIHVAVEILPALLSQIAGKSVKALAVASTKRFAGLPAVPTLAESGVPGFEASSWNGISVPAGTPAPVILRLAKEIEKALASPEVQKELETNGASPRASTPQEMTARMSSDIANWRRVIDKAGIPLQ